MTIRTAVLLSLAAAVALGIFVSAPLIVDSSRDLEPSAFPAGHAVQALIMQVSPVERVVVGPIYFFALSLLVGTGTFLLVRRAGKHGSADAARRNFLAATGAAVGTSLLTTAVGLVHGFLGVGRETGNWSLLPVILGSAPKTHPEWKDNWRGSRIAEHRRMGRTEFSVSDIALGSAGVHGELGERVVRAALERGVNYIDTAPDYVAEGSEKAIGKALKGRRDEVFLATKFCTPLGNLPAGTSPADYMSAVEASLQRLSTDRVDLIHVHGCDSVARLMDPNVHEAFDRLREQGKVRFLGFSSHTPDLVKVANSAIASGRFDVMMLAYHHGIWPELADVIHRGREEADMGIVAMKTLKGAKHRGLASFEPYAEAYSQAALKWVLGNPEVSSAIISFSELQHVDEYLYASGKRGLDGDDHALLEAYDRHIAGSYCRPHCGACLDSCPEELAIHDVLRHRMYFEDYGWEKEAMRLYAGFEKQASVCVGCSAPCVGACSQGIDISTRTQEAHALFELRTRPARVVKLAKQHIDVGLTTHDRAGMLAFWQERIGLAYEGMLSLGGGHQQHRHAMNGSVLKINHAREPLQSAPPSGYRELSIAREGQAEVQTLSDPDGNVVRLVPPGHEEIVGIGMKLAVREEAAFHNFYGAALGLERCGECSYRCGDSLLRFSYDPSAREADALFAPGYRYTTIQVWDVDAEHAHVLERGGREGRPPISLGEVARISFVRDPDGNWIELSQRASLTGALPRD